MIHRFPSILRTAALAAFMSVSATAQEYSNGGNGAAGRGPVILTPVEAYGVHPPGLDPAEAQSWCRSSRQRYIPYYAPLSPVATSARWRPWAYHPLFPYYTPYYVGYCPHRLCNPPPRRYGSDGWGRGPGPNSPLPEEPGTTPLGYDGYTSVVADDTTYWNMGGNGLVPYGAPRPAETRAPDLVDAIQASRPRGRIHFHRATPSGPAILPPAESADGQEQSDGRSSRRRTKPSEPIPPGAVSE